MQMNKLNLFSSLEKLSPKMIRMIEWLAFLILSLLFLTGLFVRARLPLDIVETVVFEKNSPFLLLLLACFVVFCFFLRNIVQKIPKHYILIFLTLYAITSFCFMLVLQPVQDILIRSDALAVMSGAQEFKQGIYTTITQNNGYFNLNPHQLGLATLEQFYLTLSPTVWTGFLANIFYVVLIILYLAKLHTLFFGQEKSSNFLMLMLVLFSPLFFHIGFLYGLLPGLCFCLLGFYHLCNFQLNDRRRSLLLAVVFLVLGVMIRKNYFIFILAIFLVECLFLFQKYQTKKLLSLLLILLVIPVSSFLVNGYYGLKIGSSLPKGTPNTAYVAMGLRDDADHPSLGGWWDGYNSNILSQHDFDQKKANEVAKEEIQERLTYFFKHPHYAYRFFSDKVISTWLEPTFESVWSAVPLLPKREYKNQLINNIVDEGLLYQLIYKWSLLMTLVIYGFSAFRLFFVLFLKKEDGSILDLYSILFFLGGFFFHLIWETKSQYAFVYVLLLIPVAVTGFDNLQEVFFLKSSSKRKSK